MNSKSTPIAVAHRGGMPENTLAAFKSAYAQGFQAAECDVQVTKDQRFVLCHDETLKRTAMSDSAHLTVPIRSVNYTDIQSVQVGDATHQEPLPLLQALLPLVPKDAVLFIELKCKEPDTIPPFVELIKPYLSNIIVISFHLELLVTLKKTCADLKVILLTTATQHPNTMLINDRDTLNKAIALCQQHQFNGLSFESSPFVNNTMLSTLPDHLLTHLWGKGPHTVLMLDYVNIEI